MADFLPHNAFRQGDPALHDPAGFIVAIFMHMAWERRALIYVWAADRATHADRLDVSKATTQASRLNFFAITRARGDEADTGRGGIDRPEFPANGRTMLIWLLGVAVFVVSGAAVEDTAEGRVRVLLGLLVAWILSGLLTPYILGLTQYLWLPPLPLAIIALTLFVFGIVVAAPTVCRRRELATTMRAWSRTCAWR
jgi:hypothetical protein